MFFLNLYEFLSLAVWKNTIEVNGFHQLFGYILQNLFFCVEQKKKIHTGLEQHQGEQTMTEFPFSVNC